VFLRNKHENSKFVQLIHWVEQRQHIFYKLKSGRFRSLPLSILQKANSETIHPRVATALLASLF